ncbi:MAG: S1 family peptidase, partial [Thermoguttaceae bacterium]
GNSAMLPAAIDSTPSSLLAGNAVPTPFEPIPGVVRIVAFDPTGQSFGSGSYIGGLGDYGLILSNWHVVCEADGLVHVHFPSGFSSFGAVVHSDKTWDLALIAVSLPPKTIKPIPIASSVPKPGDLLWIAGYGSGSYRLAGGKCERYLAPELPKDGESARYEIIDMSTSARRGDSGGPILNGNHELAGVLFGSDMKQNTAGSHCQRVQRFLQEAKTSLQILPGRPEMYFAGVERGGPRHQLTESFRPFTIDAGEQEPPRRRMGTFAGSTSSFGIQSVPRRYSEETASNHTILPVISQTYRQNTSNADSDLESDKNVKKDGPNETFPRTPPPVSPLNIQVESPILSNSPTSVSPIYGSVGAGRSPFSRHDSDYRQSNGETYLATNWLPSEMPHTIKLPPDALGNHDISDVRDGVSSKSSNSTMLFQEMEPISSSIVTSIDAIRNKNKGKNGLLVMKAINKPTPSNLIIICGFAVLFLVGVSIYILWSDYKAKNSCPPSLF